jgi:putative (di)nucleoside polyphosphate hydrolase
MTAAMSEKPYRPNVGIALFNSSGRVLIGRRFRDDGPEIILPGLEWQMPQGGIDANENPRDAVMRELWEETGAVSAEHLGETDWMSYEFPPYDGPPDHRLAKFRGQRQKWFALRFTRPRRRDRPADAAQRTTGRVRRLALGAARPGG